MFLEAVKAITRRDENEPPPPRRRGGGETDKGFVAAWRAVVRRAGMRPATERAGTIDTGKAFGDAAKATTQRAARIPAEATMAATAYPFDTLDWLHLWEANSSVDNSGELDHDYDPQQNHHSPHL